MNYWPKITAAVAAPMLLTGCLFLPGKFDANLKLMDGGKYEFTYVGEMQIFAGDDKDMTPPVKTTFNPEYARCSDYYNRNGNKRANTYYDSWRARDSSDTTQDVAVEAAAEAASDAAEEASDKLPRTVKRDCTKAELTKLEERENKNYERKKKDYEQRSEMMASVFGGAIPGNDDALKRFATKMQKYDGWEKVEYAGDNIFNVEYRASGKFDRYFAFPILNDAAMQYPFFQIVPRKTGELEIITPALGGSNGFMAMAMMGGSKGGRNNDIPIQDIAGTFTLETDGEIVVNNSTDGFQSKGKIKTIVWNVENIKESPRALIRFK